MRAGRYVRNVRQMQWSITDIDNGQWHTCYAWAYVVRFGNAHWLGIGILNLTNTVYLYYAAQ